MICKNCNAEFPDAASICPFCGTPATPEADAAASGAVNLSKASESQPVNPAPQMNNPTPPPQFNNPTPPPAGGQSFNQVPPPVNNQPYGQTPPPQQFGNPAPQPQYDQSYQGGAAEESEYDKAAKVPFTLGIVGLVANGVGLIGVFCCCWYIPQIVAIIVGIIGMVKTNNLQKDLFLIAPENQQKMKNGKTMCLISLILGIVGIVVLTLMVVLCFAAGMSEEMMDYIEANF